MTKRKPRTRVHALSFAAPCLRPATIPFTRPRGVRAVGLRYEKAVAKAIAKRYPRETTHGQWFTYDDNGDRRSCQTDVLISWLDGTGHIVFEVKLSDREGAREKLEEFYVPIVGLALGASCAAIVVTRHLSKDSDLTKVCDSLERAIALSKTCIPTLHWLGRGPI